MHCSCSPECHSISDACCRHSDACDAACIPMPYLLHSLMPCFNDGMDGPHLIPTRSRSCLPLTDNTCCHPLRSGALAARQLCSDRELHQPGGAPQARVVHHLREQGQVGQPPGHRLLGCADASAGCNVHPGGGSAACPACRHLPVCLTLPAGWIAFVSVHMTHGHHDGHHHDGHHHDGHHHDGHALMVVVSIRPALLHGNCCRLERTCLFISSSEVHRLPLSHLCSSYSLFRLQATIKIMSAWYRVTVSIDNVWLNVWGVCGGEPWLMSRG